MISLLPTSARASLLLCRNHFHHQLEPPHPPHYSLILLIMSSSPGSSAMQVNAPLANSVTIAPSGRELVDDEYKRARSSPDSQRAMMLVLPLHLNELMIQVQDGIGSVAMPVDKRAFLDAVRTNLKQAYVDTLVQYQKYLSFLHQAKLIDQDRQMIMDLGTSVLWPVLDRNMESIKSKLMDINSEWQGRSDNTRICALGESLSKLLSSTVGTQVLQQTDLMDLEERMGFLEVKIRDLLNDSNMIVLNGQLDTKRGDLMYALKCINVAETRRRSALADKNRYQQEIKNRGNDELSHTTLTHEDLQQRLQAAKHDLEHLHTSCRSDLDRANERQSQRLTSLENRRRNVEKAIQDLSPDKKAIDLGDIGWGIFKLKYEVTNDNTSKRTALADQLKAMNDETDRITAQTSAEVKAIQDSHDARARELKVAEQMAIELLSASAKDIAALLAKRTENSRTLLAVAEKMVVEAEEEILQNKREEAALTGSIAELESQINALKSEKNKVFSAFSDRMTSAKEQHQNVLATQKVALQASGCASLSSLIFVIQRLQHLIRIQNDLMMGSISLAVPVSMALQSFTEQWDAALVIRGKDETAFASLTTVAPPPLLTVIAGKSESVAKFDCIIRMLSEVGVDSGVDDALGVLETTDVEEKKELDDLLKTHAVPRLLLGTAKRNLKTESQRQAQLATRNQDAISESLYQQVQNVYRSLAPLCGLAKYEAIVGAKADDKLQIEEVE